ncbi:MAG: ATP-binding cassette domain-containing protein [Caldithrix sp.]|nr:ATP-binding cassette domain-containing protein [Caldithrix sp.]
MAILDVRNICKSYGKFKAVDDVSFEVQPGRIYGMLGPNGAGKTTTIRMVMNILIPDSGSIVLFDQPMTEQLKQRIGYLPEERGLYPKMKIIDLLQFIGELNYIPADEARKRAEQWLERLDLAEHALKKVEELSKGMQQKLQFIATVLHDPDFVIFDEPFSGLDPVNVNLVKDIMLEFKAQGKAIMLSTHMMEPAEKMCDDVLMIHKGQKVLDGNLQNILSEHGERSIQLETKGDAAFIQSLDMIKNFDHYGNYIEVQLNDGFNANDLLKAIVDKVDIIRMQSHRSSLNEIFIALAQGGKNDA